MKQSTPRGFTLVELLVVIAILGTLMGLTIPAVQRSRETSRLLNCQNNASQIAKAMLHHESSLQHFPSGGWGDRWMGIAERGSGTRQPGGWIYALLPYLEQDALHDSVEQLAASDCTAAYTELASIPLPTFACPSRRTAAPIPLSQKIFSGRCSGSLSLNEATRTDYVANGGASANCPPLESVLSLLQIAASSSGNSRGRNGQQTRFTICHRPPGNPTKGITQQLPASAILSGHSQHSHDSLGDCDSCEGPAFVSNPADLDEGDQWLRDPPILKLSRPDAGLPDLQDGLVHRMSRVVAAKIRDGLSNTYLAGEKYVMPEGYDSPFDAGDAAPMLAGYSGSIIRWAATAPAQDEPGVSRPTAYGSAHADTFTVAFCDGSVQTIAFAIDPLVHKSLASRADGEVVTRP
jgi:prepilin-type N-terminal cleavage/methylation domain-containing protein